MKVQEGLYKASFLMLLELQDGGFLSTKEDSAQGFFYFSFIHSLIHLILRQDVLVAPAGLELPL